MRFRRLLQVRTFRKMRREQGADSDAGEPRCIWKTTPYFNAAYLVSSTEYRKLTVGLLRGAIRVRGVDRISAKTDCRIAPQSMPIFH